MKIKTIRIENFRSFQDETIPLNRYACFVGSNGAGKSTVLAALNVFFQDRSASTTDISKLIDEDYYCRNTEDPVKITLTFDNLTDTAKQDLSNYVRHEELIVTAEASYNTSTGCGVVRHYGQRLAMEAFRIFFDAEKDGANAAQLSAIFDEIRLAFPNLPIARSKDDKIQALRNYESEHIADCVLISSEDDFYGVNSTGKLGRYIQWVYVPAVKDAGDEALEAKNTTFGKLISRAVQNRTNFETELEALKSEALQRYQLLLDQNQVNLTNISQALQTRLESWAHPNVRVGIEWKSDPIKSVVIQPPVAAIKTGDNDFLGSLSRMGNGLQRSYLLALLQELASSDAPNSPTLILGCEEPELYQHPPQARHMADIFSELSEGNNQLLVTTHSPLFVSGDGFENIRIIQQRNGNRGSQAKCLTYLNLCNRIRLAYGDDPARPIDGLVAKIHQALQPGIAEMFFTKVPILVEGLEDVSYITTHLYLSGRWPDFRRLGCHLIPVNGKDKLIQPLAIAKELGLPVFLVFDADGNIVRDDHRSKHERDNNALIRLLNETHPSFPDTTLIAANHAIWASNLGDQVKNDFGNDYEPLVNAARANYGNEGGLEKNELFIAEWVSAGWANGHRSNSLDLLCSAIIDHARAI